LAQPENRGITQMNEYLFIYETNNDDDDGCRTILAASMPAAIAMFKAQITAEGQTVSVSTIRGAKT
jgi:hypothetical protein